MGHLILDINNPETWLKERAKGIGGSDAASVLGLNPSKSNVDLWKEKTGRKIPADISKKPCIVYGNRAEQYLRELFILDYPEYEVTHNAYNIHINNDYNYIRASLDGELFDTVLNEQGILEIKTSEIRRGGDWAKWDRKIPMTYFCQTLHYFIIDKDFKFAKVKAQIKSKDASGETILTTKHYHILRENHKSDIETLLNKELEFWWYVENDKEPPLILPEI